MHLNKYIMLYTCMHGCVFLFVSFRIIMSV